MKVSDCLIISSGSDDSFVHEERVFEFVKRFVGGLNAKQAGAFLKYVTSHEVSTKNTVITVQFNGTTYPRKMEPCSADALKLNNYSYQNQKPNLYLYQSNQSDPAVIYFLSPRRH